MVQPRDFDPSGTDLTSRQRIQTNKILSSLAIALSSLALLLSGYTALQLAGLRNEIIALREAQTAAMAPAPSPELTPANPNAVLPETSTQPQSTTSSPASTATTAIQPGQFVQNAYGTKAKVELLSAKRIQDPETGMRDVVNVQMRIRRVGPDVVGTDLISLGETAARNPDTSETYQPVDAVRRSSGVVSLFQMRQGASADAYVWMQVPEGVSTIDLFIKETRAFKAVPIAN